MSDIRYIPICRGIRCFHYCLWNGIHSQWWVTMDLTTGGNGNADFVTTNGNVSVAN